MNLGAKVRELEEAIAELQETRAAEAEAVEEMRAERDAAIRDGNLVAALLESAEKEVEEMRGERDNLQLRCVGISQQLAEAEAERDALRAEVARLTAQLEGQQAECADWKEIAKASPSVASLVRYKDAMSEIARLRASEATWQETARVRGEALEAVEWVTFCPWCRKLHPGPHAPDCARQRALGAP